MFSDPSCFDLFAALPLLRYQGTGVGPHVASMLGKYDWTELSADVEGKEGSPLVWSTVVERLIEASHGGVKEFLGTKLLLMLALVNESPEMIDDEAELGPGAMVGLWSIFHLMATGEYIPSYQVKPSEVEVGAFRSAMVVAESAAATCTARAVSSPTVSALANEQAALKAASRTARAFAVRQRLAQDFERAEWLQKTSRLLNVTMVAYWKARLSANPRLIVLDAAMVVQLQVKLPTIVVESFLCEVLRRRNVRHTHLCCTDPC